MKRGSGILLHISSLPGKYGIGDFGREALRFADFLAKSRQGYWQLLPLNPTDPIYGNSPYSSNSAFAMNTLFIDLESLASQGWLNSRELKKFPLTASDATGFSPWFDAVLVRGSMPRASGDPKGRPLTERRVDYVEAWNFKNALLSLAFVHGREHLKDNSDYQEFCRSHSYWLEDYSLFLVLKQHFSGQEWDQWPAEFRQRNPESLERFRSQYSDKIEEVKFRQYLVFKQFFGLREYCRSRKIQLIGDIPIYVNFDSADVWAHPKIFKLDDQGRPMFLAGVPPDYFSQTGQLWGNPVYDWDALKMEDYEWWIKRIEHNLQLFDVIRIDHFRGLIGFWQVPAQETTAVNGQWQPGPGDDFFYALKETFGHELPIIAEDLGIITPDVTEAMKTHGYPGMKVLLFAFSGELSTHPYIPENYKAPCVVYTGTHDNNTAKGWFMADASKEEKKNLQEYFGKKIPKDALPWILVELAFTSPADIAIIPMQDILGLGKEARMNVPGTAQGNWEWRLLENEVTAQVIRRLEKLTLQTRRGH